MNPLHFPTCQSSTATYAVWQQRRVAAGVFANDLDFWEENLRGAPELLELPSDRPRPSVQSYRGARQRFRLNAALTEALRNRSREEQSQPLHRVRRGASDLALSLLQAAKTSCSESRSRNASKSNCDPDAAFCFIRRLCGRSFPAT